MTQPYVDYTISKTEWIRTFNPDVDSDELLWHRDKKNRIVTALAENDWLYQEDNQLPVLINKRQSIKIDKMRYHRIIKGSTKLVLHIQEV